MDGGSLCLAPSGQGRGERQRFKPKVMLSVEETVGYTEFAGSLTYHLSPVQGCSNRTA